MDSPAVLFAQIRAPRAALADYDEWYLAEHVPERLAVPGFESFERYERLDDVAAASTAHREYLTTYRVRSLAVLTSPEYLQRLDNPTPLTRRFSPLSTVVRRLACRVEAAAVRGRGGWLGALVAPAGENGAERGAAAEPVLQEALGSDPRLLAARLLRSDERTSEAYDRTVEGAAGGPASAPDVGAWVLIAEGTAPEVVAAGLDRLRRQLGLDATEAAYYRPLCALDAQ
jgi:hypothetical protein